jgi:cell division protein FtsB
METDARSPGAVGVCKTKCENMAVQKAGKIDVEAIRKQHYRPLNGSRILIRIIIGMLLVLVLASAFAIYFEQEKQMARIGQRKNELSATLQEAAADLADLRELQQIVDSDAYIERIARDQLGMVRPDEIVFIED